MIKFIVIKNYMERNKSSKQSQSQLLKQVLAQFDIETQVNKIAIRCFNDLLRTNKQAFDIIIQSQRKITDFQTRLCKSEGFAQSIEKNVSNKIEIANNLNRRLETFSNEFYAEMKQNEQLVQTIRKDYDSLVSATQKNTYELRSITDNLKKDGQTIELMGKRVTEQIAGFTYKVNEQQLQNQKYFGLIRTQQQALRAGLTEARTNFISKSEIFEETSKDMALYKYEKDTINRRLIDIMNQVQLKMSRSDFNQFRLLLDSRLVTEHQHNSRTTSDLRTMLKEQKEQRKDDVKDIINDSTNRWKQQQSTNLSNNDRLGQLRHQFAEKHEKSQSRVDSLQLVLRKQLEILQQKQFNDITWSRQQIKKANDKIEQNATKIFDCEKFMQQRYDQSVEMNSTINALSERLDQINRETNQRRKEMSQNHLGQSVNSINDIVARLQQQLYQVNKSIIAITKQTSESKRRCEEVSNQLKDQQRSILNVINSDKAEIQVRFTQVNRHINDVSIQIMKKLHQSEQDGKKYTNKLIGQIKEQLEFLERVSKQVQQLQKAFAEQMKETRAINLSISQKMQKVTANMTKFKSDLSMRVDGILNEQQRRSIQTKQMAKRVEDSCKHLGYLTEGLIIGLSVLAHREYLQQNEGIKQIKISSLLEGWVLEIDEKQAKYRGQHFLRRKVVVAYLNFLIFNSDKIKGTLIESGKDVYNRMIEQSQEIFTARKKCLSRRIGSELPKLHL